MRLLTRLKTDRLYLYITGGDRSMVAVVCMVRGNIILSVSCTSQVESYRPRYGHKPRGLGAGTPWYNNMWASVALLSPTYHAFVAYSCYNLSKSKYYHVLRALRFDSPLLLRNSSHPALQPYVGNFIYIKNDSPQEFQAFVSPYSGGSDAWYNVPRQWMDSGKWKRSDWELVAIRNMEDTHRQGAYVCAKNQTVYVTIKSTTKIEIVCSRPHPPSPIDRTGGPLSSSSAARAQPEQAQPAMATKSSKLYSPHSGDFLIQTSDAVLFGVHRILLGLSSPVMSDMFALGATTAPQTTPGAFLLLPFNDETFCLITFSTVQSRFLKTLKHFKISCPSYIPTNPPLSSRVSMHCCLCSAQPANTR